MLEAANGPICVRYAWRKVSGKIVFAGSMLAASAPAAANGDMPPLEAPADAIGGDPVSETETPPIGDPAAVESLAVEPVEPVEPLEIEQDYVVVSMGGVGYAPSGYISQAPAPRRPHKK